MAFTVPASPSVTVTSLTLNREANGTVMPRFVFPMLSIG